jgi:hypothetical protein
MRARQSLMMATFAAKLRTVIHLLKIAAAAASEINARRFLPFRRRLDDFDDFGKRGFAFDLIDFNSQSVARRGKRDENGQVFRERQTEPPGTIFSIFTCNSSPILYLTLNECFPPQFRCRRRFRRRRYKRARRLRRRQSPSPRKISVIRP